MARRVPHRTLAGARWPELSPFTADVIRPHGAEHQTHQGAGRNIWAPPDSSPAPEVEQRWGSVDRAAMSSSDCSPSGDRPADCLISPSRLSIIGWGILTQKLAPRPTLPDTQWEAWNCSTPGPSVAGWVTAGPSLLWGSVGPSPKREKQELLLCLPCRTGVMGISKGAPGWLSVLISGL